MSNLVRLGVEYFPDDDKGKPVGGGSIYVGSIDTDPEVVVNQKQVKALQEDGSYVNMTQPITLSAGGVPLYNGSPVSLYVTGNFSVKVLDMHGSQVYYVPSYFSYDDNDPFIPGNYYYPDYTEADQGVVGNANTINYYVDLIGSNEATLYFRHNSGSQFTDYTLLTSETIPSNIKLEFEKGARIDVNTGVTFTINGPITAGEWHIFKVSGTLDGSPKNREIHPAWFGVTADGSTDDTTAMQAAIDFAVATRVELRWPKGIVYVTDELAIRGPIVIRGHGSGLYEAGHDNLASRLFYDHATATKGGIAFTDIIDGVIDARNSIIEGLEIMAAQQVADQPGMRIDGTIHQTKFLDLEFHDVAGAAIQFTISHYSQNLYFANVSFHNVGGLIGYDTAPTSGDLVCTLFRMDNINLDHSINPTSPQTHLVDLRAIREVNIDQLLLEGTGAPGVTSCVAIASNTFYIIDGVHLEWPVDNPTYSFYIDENGYTSSDRRYLSVTGLVTSLPIRVETTLGVALRIMHWATYYATSIDDLVSEIAGSVATGIFEVYNTAGLIPMSLSSVGRYVVRVGRRYGSDYVAVHQSEHSDYLLKYDGGHLNSAKESGFAYFSVSSTDTEGVATDAVQGRVYKMSSLTGLTPNLNWNISLPSEYQGAHMVAIIKYKAVTTSSPFSFYSLYATTGVSINGVANEQHYDGEWYHAYLAFQVASGYANILIQSRHTAVVPDAAVDFYVAAAHLIIGRNICDINSLVHADNQIHFPESSVPSDGDHLVGDVVWDTAPSAGGHAGWICVTAGNPGTWKTFGDITA